jgi:hypothetical protein
MSLFKSYDKDYIFDTLSCSLDVKCLYIDVGINVTLVYGLKGY